VTGGRALGLDDIADARAYERERGQLLARIVELKKLRRVAVGPVVSLVFENRDTVRFQIQEMARAERLHSDEAIQVELDTYNPLIPGPGELSATMLIELTDRAEMEHWLPRLVGVERAVLIEVGPQVVPCVVDPTHAAHLTREDVTAAVHFVRFQLTPAQIGMFRSGPAAVAIDHPGYRERTGIGGGTRKSLLQDLLG
jgi:hypothetical protein